MKALKILSIIILTLLSNVIVSQNDTMYVYQKVGGIFKIPVNNVDSVIFYDTTSTLIDTTSLNTCSDTIDVNDVLVSISYITKLNEFTEGNYGSIDFSAGGALIKATLPTIVNWKITLYNNNNQKKEFAGTGKEISIQWYGNVDSIVNDKFLFNTGKVNLQLEVTCKNEILISKDFSVKGSSNFTGVRDDFGFLIRDWDKNGAFPVSSNNFSASDGWAGAGGGATLSVNYENTNSSPAGGYYLDMHAVSTSPEWYLGTTSFPAPFSNYYKIGNGEPYINIFVKGNDNYSNQSVQIGVQIPGVTYIYYAPLDWSGWRLVSIKLSDFRTSNGVYLTDLDYPNIESIVLQLGAEPQPSKEVQLYYDFIFLSYDKPLSNKNSLVKY